MKMKSIVTLIASVLFFASAEAQQVLSYFAQTPLSAASTSMIELPGFDSSFGTLTQVQLVYAGDVWQTLFAENLSDERTRIALSTKTTLGLKKVDGPAFFIGTVISSRYCGRLGQYDGVTDFANQSGVKFSQHASVHGVYVDPVLSSYLDVESVAFKLTSQETTSLHSGGNVIGGASNYFEGGLTIAYTYTAIPEVETYASVLGIVAFASGVMARRRKILPA